MGIQPTFCMLLSPHHYFKWCVQLIVNCYGQEGAEAGASTNQMHQGGVLALGVMPGEVAMMWVIETTTDRGEMVSIGQVPGQTEDSQVNKYQEVDTIHQSLLISIFLTMGSNVLSQATQISAFTFVTSKTIIWIFSEVSFILMFWNMNHISCFFFFLITWKGSLILIFFLEGNY